MSHTSLQTEMKVSMYLWQSLSALSWISRHKKNWEISC